MALCVNRPDTAVGVPAPQAYCRVVAYSYDVDADVVQIRPAGARRATLTVSRSVRAVRDASGGRGSRTNRCRGPRGLRRTEPT